MWSTGQLPGTARHNWGHGYLLIIFSMGRMQKLHRFALEENLLSSDQHANWPSGGSSVALPWWACGGLQAARWLESLCKAEDQPCRPNLAVVEMIWLQIVVNLEGQSVEQACQRQVAKICKVAGLGCSGVSCLRAGHRSRPTRADLDEAASGPGRVWR